MLPWPPSKITEITHLSLPKALDNGFRWCKTPEGHEYWSGVVFNLMKMSGSSDRDLRMFREEYDGVSAIIDEHNE